ncbi:MAG: hypothetical protein GQ527_05550 [Bacteroidales bacterium]|nr:hypothetical protein [Bacteroidales bacterium]
MKKFIKYFLLLILGIIILSFFFDMNSAHIEEVKICTQLDANQCAMDKPVFDVNTPQIVVSCKLENPPMGTEVEFSWYYITGGKTKIDAVVVNNGEEIGNINLNSSLNMPSNGWPTGDYEVVIKILNTEKEPIIKNFWVK